MSEIILRKAQTGFRPVTGGIVAKLQRALNASGFSVGKVDSIFGPGSSAALSSWQESVGQTPTGNATTSNFLALTGKAPEDFELCLQVTASFEGHGFELAMGNFDGALITWGVIGFTFKSGSLQQLICMIDREDPDAVKTAFAELEPELRSFLNRLPKDSRAKEIADGLTLKEGKERGALRQDWRDAFAKLGRMEATRNSQLALARATYWKTAERDAKRLQLQGRAGLALTFDIAVQNGGVSDTEFDAYEASLAKFDPTITQLNKRKLIADIVAEASKPAYIENVRARKRAIATGKGTVHGSIYDLKDWGVAAPANEANFTALATVVTMATAPTTAAPATRFSQEFSAYIASIGLNYFSPEEFAFLGASHSTLGSPGYGLNQLPPQELWPNIRRTAQIMDKLRKELKASIYLTNVYRSDAYNAAIKGAPGSTHTRFNAVDFVCKDGNQPGYWANKLKLYRSEGLFSGGIGIYPSKNFVHLDTRGQNRNFGE